MKGSPIDGSHPFRIKPSTSIVFLFLLIHCICVSGNLMGVDFGSSFLKVSIARPGKGIELVTNEQSKRKTPAAVGFTPEGERLFGDAALSYAGKAPDRVITYGRDFLKRCQDGETKDRSCEKRKVSIEGVGEFSGEQIAAMLLGLARKHAAITLTGKGEVDPKVIKDVVITVPSTFDIIERGRLVDAAELIGLNVLSLVNTPTAAALKYALDNKGMKALVEERKRNNEKDVATTIVQKVMIFDMGATSASASAAEITSNVKQNRATKVDVLAHGATENSSGRALDDIVVKQLCKEFDAQDIGGGTKCYSLPRVVVRLRKAAQRAKEVLSANTDAFVNVPSLYGDNDFRATLKRGDFEESAADVFAAAQEPVKTVLKAASWSADSVDAIVPVGGASRTPKIQDSLLKASGKKTLNKSLNADEAAVLGAAYYAASLSSTFRVREISLRDVQPFAIYARIDRDKKKAGLFSRGGSETAGDPQEVKVFEAGSKRPARKSVAVKRSVDFGVTVYLGDERQTVLSKFRVEHVDKVLKRMKDKKLAGSTTPKVSLTFQLDPSGFVKVGAAEAAVDESVTVTYTPSPSPSPSKKAEKSSSDDKSDDSAAKEAAESATPKPSPTTKVQMLVHRETVKLKYDEDASTTQNGRLSAEEKKEAARFLHGLETADLERGQIADALNALESEILTTRSKVRGAHEMSEDEDDESVRILNKVTSPEEREKVIEFLDETESWMFEEGSRQLSLIKEKMAALSKSTKDMFYRAAEFKQRPEIIATFESALQNMKKSYEPLQALHKERSSEHVSKFDDFGKAISDAKIWLKEKVSEQDKMALTANPILSANDIEERSKKLLMSFASLGRLKLPDSPTPSPTVLLDDAKKGSSSIENETTKEPKDGKSSDMNPNGEADSRKAGSQGVGDVKDEL